MKVVWTRGARDDLDRIQAYLLPRSPAGAQRIWTRIVDRVGAQGDIPYAAPTVGRGPVRRLVITRTPYVVLYVVDEGELRVLSVHHGRQNR